MFRSTIRFATRTFAAGAALLAAEAIGAYLRPVPTQPEFDASGVVGDGSVRQRWLVLGDSSTTAPGVSGPDEIWVRQLAAARADSGAIEITSLAVGGTRARHVRDEQLPLIAADARYDIVFVSVGANDVLKGEPIDRYRVALEAVVAELTPRHGRLVLSGVGDLSTIPRLVWPLDRLIGSRARRFDGVAESLARQWGASKVDHWTQTAPVFRSDPALFSPDLFHPSARGHKVWADAVDQLLTEARA